MTEKTPLGPNVRRLMAERAAQLQVESAVLEQLAVMRGSKKA
jgi:hypothetical protein